VGSFARTRSQNTGSLRRAVAIACAISSVWTPGIDDWPGAVSGDAPPNTTSAAIRARVAVLENGANPRRRLRHG
jgi:hypothetical protein